MGTCCSFKPQVPGRQLTSLFPDRGARFATARDLAPYRSFRPFIGLVLQSGQQTNVDDENKAWQSGCFQDSSAITAQLDPPHSRLVLIQHDSENQSQLHDGDVE